jgi:hypothetical protein
MAKDKAKPEFMEFIELTTEECDQIGLRLAQKKLEHAALEKEKSEVDAEYNSKLRVLEAEQLVLAKERNDHRREVEIQTREVFDEARQMVLVVRADNEAVVLKSRDFTVHEKGKRFAEKQPGLFDGSTDPDAEPDAPADDDDGRDARPYGRDADPAPDEIEHKGQRLRKVPRQKPNQPSSDAE